MRASIIKKHRLDNVLLMGDFNDVNLKVLPEVLVSELSINFINRMKVDHPRIERIPTMVMDHLYKNGFLDACEYIKSEHPLYSCWSGRKVDHIMIYTDTWDKSIIIDNVFIHYNNYSDHVPLLIDLYIKD